MGLEVAIRGLAEQLEEQHGVATTIEDDGQPKPTCEEVRATLFRAVRELIRNVVKHAGTRRVHVSLTRRSADIQIEISDTGHGFDVTELDALARQRSAFGLLSTRERLEYLGGRMEIESAPGKGTRIRLYAPLAVDEATPSYSEDSS